MQLQSECQFYSSSYRIKIIGSKISMEGQRDKNNTAEEKEGNFPHHIYRLIIPQACSTKMET